MTIAMLETMYQMCLTPEAIAFWEDVLQMCLI